MILTNLPDLHKLLKGIGQQDSNILTIDLVNQRFNQKSLVTFIQRISQIPEKIQHLDIIMRDNDYDEGYNPSNKDFSMLKQLHVNYKSLKVNFKNIFQDADKEINTLNLLAKIGKKLVKKCKELQCIELITNNFKLKMMESHFNLYLAQSQKHQKLEKVLTKIKSIVLKWQYQLQSIEINIDFSKGIQQEKVFIELLQSLNSHKRAQIIKINILMNQSQSQSQTLNNQVFNFHREDIKVFEYIIEGDNAFNYLSQVQNLNSNLTYAHFYFKDPQHELLSIKLQKKSLNIKLTTNNSHVLSRINEIRFNQNIMTWNLERVETLELEDQSTKFFNNILKESKLRSLKNLTLKIKKDYYFDSRQLTQISLKEISNSMKFLKELQKLEIIVFNCEFQQNELKDFCGFLTTLDNLESLVLNFKASKFNQQDKVCNIMNQQLINLSQTLKVFQFKCPTDYYDQYQFRSQNRNYQIYELLPTFSSLANIQEFSVNDSNSTIKYLSNNLYINLIIDNDQDIVPFMNSFSNQTLRNKELNSIEINLQSQNKLKGKKKIIRALLKDINPVIQNLKIHLYLSKDTQNKFNFKLPLKNYKGNLCIQINNQKRIQIDSNSFKTYVFYEDILQDSSLEDQIEEKSKDKGKSIEIQSDSEEIDQSENDNIPEQEKSKKNNENKPNEEEIDLDNEQVKSNDSQKMKEIDLEQIAPISPKFQRFYKLLSGFNNKKQCIIKFNYYQHEFFKGLIQNFPKNESIKLSLKRLNLDDSEVIHLKDIFLNVSKSLRELDINLSQNPIHNQGSVTFFLKLHKLKKWLQSLALNLSETFIRTKGIISLTRHICKFRNIRKLELNISNPQTYYDLKSDVINNIFKAVHQNQKPDLESFELVAKNSHIEMDNNFFESLINLFKNVSKSLKKNKRII